MLEDCDFVRTSVLVIDLFDSIWAASTSPGSGTGTTDCHLQYIPITHVPREGSRILGAAGPPTGDCIMHDEGVLRDSKLYTPFFLICSYFNKDTCPHFILSAFHQQNHMTRGSPLFLYTHHSNIENPFLDRIMKVDLKYIYILLNCS